MINLYTDGSFDHRSNSGGWAYFVDDSLKGSGISKSKFANSVAMEMLAVVVGLNRLKKMGYERVRVVGDNKKVIGLLQNESAPKKGSFSTRVFRRAFKLKASFDQFEAVWIPEHTSHEQENAHRMSCARMKELRDGRQAQIPACG